jgi:hypothetical protein
VTLAAWINTNSLTTQQAIILRGLSDGPAGAGGTQGYGLWIDANGHVNLGAAGGGNFDSLTVLTPGWHQVTGIINGSASKIYIDGVDRTPTGVNVNVTSSSQNLIIGAARNNASNAYSAFFNGLIDEVRVYNRALSPAEIQALAQTASAPGTPTGLLATAGNAQVALSWTASSGASSYNLYRSTSSGGEGSTPYRTGISGTTFIDTGLSNGTRYYYQVTAVNSTAESAKSSEVSAIPVAGLVSNFAVKSSNAYQWATLSAGQAVYSDRSYTYLSVPAALNGQLVLQTANNDKLSTDPSFISFTVNQSSTVYVMDSPANATLESDWLNAAHGWTLQSYTATVSTVTAGTRQVRVWSKTFAAGSQVTLGGNEGTSDSNMYTVVIAPITS